MDNDLASAWEQVHANTPEGWFVGNPGCEERYRHWSQFAFDPSEKAVMGGRERQWIATGQTELDCLWEMARCLGELKAGRWPM